MRTREPGWRSVWPAGGLPWRAIGHILLIVLLEMVMARSATRTRLSTKGQVILPKSVRDRLKWMPGTELSVEETAEGVILRRSVERPAARLDDVFGSLRAEGRRLSLEEMDAAVAAEAGRRARD